jgi:hypothetical protein
MFEILARLVERLTERPQLDSPDDAITRWLAAVLVSAVAAIVYDAPKEAYLLLGLVLVLVLLFVGRRKSA